MKCRACGKENRGKATICAHCGASLYYPWEDYTTVPQGTTQQIASPTIPHALKQKKTGKIASILVPVTAIVIAFTCAIGLTFWLGDSVSTGKDDSSQASYSQNENTENKDEEVVVRNEGSSSKVMESTGSSSGSSSSSSSSTHTNSEVYQTLTNDYTMAGQYDTQLIDVATEFNSYYTDSSKTLRSAKQKTSGTLKQSIYKDWNTLKNYQVDFWSNNYEAWEQLCEAYEYLYYRINVIDESWKLSVSYDKPSEHVKEITKPIERQKDSNGKDIYYLKFKALYPQITIVKE